MTPSQLTKVLTLIHIQESQLVRVLVVSNPNPGMFETAADNIKFRLAHPATHFFILVHDDQVMTAPGWNVLLAQPARRWGDVFSVSMRCAHDWIQEGNLVGKCLNVGALFSLFCSANVKKTFNVERKLTFRTNTALGHTISLLAVSRSGFRKSWTIAHSRMGGS